MALLTAQDVRQSFQPGDARGHWLSIDYGIQSSAQLHSSCRARARHTSLPVRAQTLSLHSLLGARFSSFWWQRLGAAITRTIHAMLSSAPHRTWLHVDRLLNLSRGLDGLHQPRSWHLFREALDEQACIKYSPIGIWPPHKGKVLEIGTIKISGKTAMGPQWVCIARHSQSGNSPSQRSKGCNTMVSALFTTPHSCNMSAADAMAESTAVGI